jgi:hypothetical protein
VAIVKASAFRAEPRPDPLRRTLVDVAIAIAERKRLERAERRRRLAVVRDDIVEQALPGGWTSWVLPSATPRAMVVMPARDPSWPADVLAAYDCRVEANLTGVCPSCGAMADIAAVAPNQARGQMPHDDDCAAISPRLIAAIAQ